MPVQTPEAAIQSKLSGDAKTNALDFAVYLRANDIQLDGNEEGSGWAVGGMTGNSLGYLMINGSDEFPGPWTFWFNSCDFGNAPVSDVMKQTAWDHASPCGREKCHAGWEKCGGGNRVMFGKEFGWLCHSPLMFNNPDAKTMEPMKQLMEIQSAIIAVETVKTNALLASLAEDEWPSGTEIGAHAGRPLGKTYTESLEVTFDLTLRRGDIEAGLAFSGGGWIPDRWQHIPAGLRIGTSGGIEAYKGPNEWWTAVDQNINQANATYRVEMAFNIRENLYSSTVWTLDTNGGKDKSHRVAVDFPFRVGAGTSAQPTIPKITAIDTVYLGPGNGKAVYIIRNFKVIGGK
ncbi:MAG: hypothetical protein FWD16_05515 [Clostridia bacterium]|nr:hypothetical protein [Clostridia bacterium]